MLIWKQLYKADNSKLIRGPQVLSGFQGHPSAGGVGGRHPDGEDCSNRNELFASFLIFSHMLRTALLYFLFPQVATDVIKEFAADGVKYLELRSTPREEKNTGNDVNIEMNIWFIEILVAY